MATTTAPATGASVLEAAKAARIWTNPYEEWVQREGLLVHRDVGVYLPGLETKPWPRFGVNGAVVHLTGQGDFGNAFLVEIPGGKWTEPQRHLFEEVYFVVEGRGSTHIELPDGRSHSFEWQPNSMFAIPLNVKYRLYNADGSKRALLTSVTNLPLTMKLYHNDKFIFENDFFFADRVGKDSYYDGSGDLTMIRAGQNMWETNFVPDLVNIELTAWNERGAGSMNLMFLLGDGNMHAHVSQIQSGTYKKAHRHGPGAHIFTLNGKGYSLLWLEGEKDFKRVDWGPGWMFAPVDRQFHQHFATSEISSRYLALIPPANARYPFLNAKRPPTAEEAAAQSEVATSTKQGGQQVEYEDQDPRVHQIWLEEMKKNGITPQFDKFAGKGAVPK